MFAHSVVILLAGSLCFVDIVDASCKWSSWGSWGGCSKSCGPGTRTRSRKLINTRGGRCPYSVNFGTGSCNKCCPADCRWGSWGKWGACSKTCDGGTQTRNRVKTRSESCGGSCTGLASATRTCNTVACPGGGINDCAWSQWTAWCCACTRSCGGGHQTRTRYITKDASKGGKCPGESRTTRACNTQCCPVNCLWAVWSEWGLCNYAAGKTCGNGSRSRSRTHAIPATCGGRACKGVSKMTQSCTSCCPTNCVWASWQNWCACSKSCGGGTQWRKRHIAEEESCGGICPGTPKETRTCNTGCCPRDCMWAGWASWGSCYYGVGKSCGTGTQKRTRRQSQTVFCGGKACLGTDTDTKTCSKCCPTDCTWNSWSAWQACSKSCGGGSQIRTRSIRTPASCGGKCPGSTSQSQTCNRQCCPYDCIWGDWGTWKGCKGGRMIRERKVVSKEGCGGKCVGEKTQSMTCSCTSWSKWNRCYFGNTYKQCGSGGTQKRTRTCKSSLGSTPDSESQSCYVPCTIKFYVVEG